MDSKVSGDEWRTFDSGVVRDLHVSKPCPGGAGDVIHSSLFVQQSHNLRLISAEMNGRKTCFSCKRQFERRVCIPT